MLSFFLGIQAASVCLHSSGKIQRSWFPSITLSVTRPDCVFNSTASGIEGTVSRRSQIKLSINLYINLKVYVFLLIARCSTGLYPVRYEFRKYKYYIRTTQRSEAFTECRAALHPGTATGQDDCGWFAAAYGCIWVQRRHMCLCQRWTCFE